VLAAGGAAGADALQQLEALQAEVAAFLLESKAGEAGAGAGGGGAGSWRRDSGCRCRRAADQRSLCL
jgi:hypothetical protein